MPDPTNLEQIQEQKAQETYAAEKQAAVRRALSVLDPRWRSEGQEYWTLVDRLHTLLGEELEAITRPSKAAE